MSDKTKDASKLLKRPLRRRQIIKGGIAGTALLAGTSIFAPRIVKAAGGSITIGSFQDNAMAPFRDYFYRHASLLSGPFEGSTAMSLIVLVICVLALAVIRHQTPLSGNDAWWAVVMAREVPNSVRLVNGTRRCQIFETLALDLLRSTSLSDRFCPRYISSANRRMSDRVGIVPI